MSPYILVYSLSVCELVTNEIITYTCFFYEMQYFSTVGPIFFIDEYIRRMVNLTSERLRYKIY